MNIHELEQDLGWILTQIEDTDKQDKMADLEGISNG
jgi:hypothetical protein